LLLKKVVSKILFFPLLILWCITSGCQNHNKTPSDPGQNTLRIGAYGDFFGVDPYNVSGVSSIITRLVYDPLGNVTSISALEGFIVATFDHQKGGKSWSLKLHENILFHDGTSLKALDVKSTFECAKKYPNAKLFKTILDKLQDIKIENDHTLVLQLSSVEAQLPLSFFMGVSKSGDTPCDKNIDFQHWPLGSGPYMISHMSKSQVTLIKNPHYWKGIPKINKIVFDFYPSKNEAWIALLQNKLDLLYDNNSETTLLTQNVAHLHNLSIPMDFFHMILFNMGDANLLKRPMRQALNYAVDRQAIINRLLDKEGVASAGIIAPTFTAPGFLPLQPYAYDPEKAIRLIQSAGYRQDPKTHLFLNHGKPLVYKAVGIQGEEESAKLLREIQNYLKDVGITLSIKMVPPDQLMTSIMQKDFSLCHIYSMAYSNPSLLFSGWYGDYRQSFFPYYNKNVHQLFDNYFSSEALSEVAFLNEFQKQLYEDPPGIFLYWKNNHLAVHRRLMVAEPSWVNNWSNIWQWSLDPNWEIAQ
jgi:peptide/nickel transport system substrate-binding protein